MHRSQFDIQSVARPYARKPLVAVAMKKDECETIIRHLCHEWAKLRGIRISAENHPSFADFYSWVEQNYRSYLKFQTKTSVQYDVEMWFDDEMKQNWRR
jgi:hypothetical protein